MYSCKYGNIHVTYVCMETCMHAYIHGCILEIAAAAAAHPHKQSIDHCNLGAA